MEVFFDMGDGTFSMPLDKGFVPDNKKVAKPCHQLFRPKNLR